ncbi:hypothetical protein STEG23_002041, partial [Scotinomys teguina]
MVGVFGNKTLEEDGHSSSSLERNRSVFSGNMIAALSCRRRPELLRALVSHSVLFRTRQEQSDAMVGTAGLAGYTWLLSKQLLEGQLCENMMSPEEWRTVTVTCGTLQQPACSWGKHGPGNGGTIENGDNLE